ncbi:hypothetical protein SO802_015077 [Lithocarpus litseifolius]|uniref:Uncharacterized protein n=1 Tax=Lithocarpus litseifolius TaxID=425828 RepID=A0AAW2CY03_9ROSI
MGDRRWGLGRSAMGLKAICDGQWAMGDGLGQRAMSLGQSAMGLGVDWRAGLAKQIGNEGAGRLKKWDHLRKGWKQYNECFDNETRLGFDAGTGMLQASDEWWTRKIAACPNAKTFKNKDLLNRDFMNIMFGGTVATGKNAFCTNGQIPKETIEGSGDSANST